MRKLNKKFPQSSQITINKSNFTSVINTIKFRPILTTSWLVKISPRLTIKQIARVMKYSDNVNILLLNESTKLDDIKEGLLELDIKFNVVNNLEIASSEIISYVYDMLPITLADAKYLCNRHRMYLPTIMNSVNTLIIFDKVDRNIIKKYTKRYDGVSLNTIVDSMLGLVEGKRNKVIEQIYAYRFGLDFLLKFILDELNKYQLVFELIESGELTLKNYREFKANCTLKEKNIIKKISDYRLYNMIEAYSLVSNSLLFFVKTSVELIKPRQEEIYKIIMLLK